MKYEHFLLLFLPRSTLQNYLKRHEGNDLKKREAPNSNPFEKGELLDQWWANFLTYEPQWVVKFGRGTGAGADEWSVLVTHLIVGKNTSCQLKMNQSTHFD